MFQEFKANLIRLAEDRGYSCSDINIEKSIIAVNYNTLILGQLNDFNDRDRTLEQVDTILNIVLEQRKLFNSAKASDMYLFMIAPPNSEGNSFWQSIASEIERDDRLARKHVWLPNSTFSNLHSFVEGTFMAHPWLVGTEASHALDFLTEELVLPAGWEEILLNEEIDGTDMVNELIKLESSI